MFENIIGQPITERLKSDIINESLAPSILFEGKNASGKCTSALELARILSCEKKDAPWNCTCSSCNHHKTLSSSDLLLLGNKDFSAEILAAKAAFIKDMQKLTTRLFFLRAVKKLLLRFSFEIVKGDTRISKLNSSIEAINEDLEELLFLVNVYLRSADETSEKSEKDFSKIQKITDKLVQNLIKLESDGVADSVPVSHIRNASYWLRLKPAGIKKILIIENADKMKNEARNSLLKILEEPPPQCEIILTTNNLGAMLPTILSRLRQYSFADRSPVSQSEIIRRVFKGDDTESNIIEYMDKFLPVSASTLQGIAAFFWTVLLNNSLHSLSKQNKASHIETERQSNLLTKIKEYFKSIANEKGFTDTNVDQKTLCALVIKCADNFVQRNSFNIFLNLLCGTLSAFVKKTSVFSDCIGLCELLLRTTEEARIAYGIYNQSAAIVLESLFVDIQNGIKQC
ncbi:MAG: hypothetical protein Ta2B_04840 [Termitinemataceae bacterium]|nr:MAG: hypothetical protein Ta2B_04840 [Termitinemataceae bacterium]